MNESERQYNFFEKQADGSFWKYSGRLIKETDTHFIIFDTFKNKEFWLLKVDTRVEEM